MSYPINYAYPAKTWTRITLGSVCSVFGATGILVNIIRVLTSGPPPIGTLRGMFRAGRKGLES